MWNTVFEIGLKYVPIKLVGRGLYGVVCSSINRETNERVAIKKISNTLDNPISALRTLRELKLLRNIQHCNVIALRDVMMPSHRLSFKDVYLAYELIDTDLDRIINSSKPISNDHRNYFLFQAPIFLGTDCLNQLNLIIDLLGSQQEEDFEFIKSPKAKEYIKSLSFSRGVDFSRCYPSADPLAVDLLQKMLVFNPTKRISAMEALEHPYRRELRDPKDYPLAHLTIDLDVDEKVGEDAIREMILKEMLYYRPEASSSQIF